jgi:hypothetical protein
MPAQGQVDKARYELQERCGKQAAQTFKKEWGDGKYGDTMGRYENHYSVRLNKCFYLEIATSFTRGDDGIRIIKIMRLYDLHENKEYGIFSEGGLPVCGMLGTRCKSEAEWRQLAKPYLEE